MYCTPKFDLVTFDGLTPNLCLVFSVMSLHYLFDGPMLSETRALSCPSWLCTKSQAFMVGYEPEGPVSTASTGEGELAITRPYTVNGSTRV